MCWDLRDIEIQSIENAQLERAGIVERRDPELRGHESIEDAQQKPVNESAEFEREGSGLGSYRYCNNYLLPLLFTLSLLTTTHYSTHYYYLL